MRSKHVVVSFLNFTGVLSAILCMSEMIMSSNAAILELCDFRLACCTVLRCAWSKIWWICDCLFVFLSLSMFWGIMYELYYLIFLILFDIAIGVYITKHGLLAWRLLDFCVPGEDECLFFSWLFVVMSGICCEILNDSYLVSMLNILFRRLSFFLVLSGHSSKVGQVAQI